MRKTIVGLVATFCGGLALYGCLLIPVTETQCSDSRPCAAGYLCNRTSSTCVAASELSDAGLADGGGDSAPGLPACTVEAQCQSGQACRSGHCTPCIEHGDCDSGICEYLARDTPSLGVTACRKVNIIYVDNQELGSGCVSGDGQTLGSPLCTLDEGVARATTEGKVVRLQPRQLAYAAPTAAALANKSVAVYGQRSLGGSGGAQLASASGSAVSLSDKNSNLLLDGVDIHSTAAGAIICTGGATLTVLRSYVHDSAGVGVSANACTLRIHRTAIARNSGGALDLQLLTGYRITNNILYRNGSKLVANNAVYFFGCSGTFAFNTVAFNQALSPAVGGLACNGTSGMLLRNLIYYNAPGTGTSQLVQCDGSTSVLSPDNPAGDPVFVSGQDNYRLAAGVQTNIDCCVDRGDANQDLNVDYYGQPRTKGVRADVGAAELW